jgi:hypothetical protein
MAAYWAMFALPVAALFTRVRVSPALGRFAWYAVGVAFLLLIGLRHQVGGDWYSYHALYLRVAPLGLREALIFGGSDPGYVALNWFAARLGAGIWFVNLVCGALVMAGVTAFCRRQPLPWLALAVAVPYLLVVVAMGYTRQSAALGCALLGLVALQDGRLRVFVAWVAFGALFHKSAVLLLPFAALAGTERRLWTACWVGVVTLMLAALVLLEHHETLWRRYVAAGMVSEGGGIRVAMNALPAALLLAFRRRLTTPGYERNLWTWLALFALAMVPLLPVASTAVDRVALYFLPLQALVFARLPLLFSEPTERAITVLAIVAFYGGVLWIWLNYALNAPHWIPYQFGPLV